MLKFPDESFDPNGLLASNYPTKTQAAALTGSAALAAGAVLGVITASGKMALSLAASEDGSETPVAILAEAADPSSGDVAALVFVSGDFVSDALTYGTGHDAASVAAAFSGAPLFVTSRAA